MHQLSEELRDVAREALGHFDGGEVSAARHWCPLTDVVEAFGPLARKGALGDKLVCEDGDRRLHIDEIFWTERVSGRLVVVVVPDRGRYRLCCPVDCEDGEQELP
jgi:hypothetical protein